MCTCMSSAHTQDYGGASEIKYKTSQAPISYQIDTRCVGSRSSNIAPSLAPDLTVRTNSSHWTSTSASKLEDSPAVAVQQYKVRHSAQSLVLALIPRARVRCSSKSTCLGSWISGSLCPSPPLESDLPQARVSWPPRANHAAMEG